ncbi:MAG: EAL domain-containing protein [Lachnospiraceae bacterium]|nr:EAL domain-containing protein [Lachnospiraceae bacterium]
MWSLEFDISALTVCLLFLIYYCLGRNLPIRRNRLFLSLLVMQTCLTVADILSAFIASYPDFFRSNMIYISNMVYYCFLAIVPLVFCAFCYYVVNADKVKLKTYLIINVPAILVIIIVLSTPVNHLIFFVSEHGIFHYGPGRVIMYIETVFYMLLSTVFVLRNSKKVLRRRHIFAILGYISVMILTHSLQCFVFPFTQIVSLGAVIGITAIALAFQNPDYYRESRTELYNLRGLELYTDEEYYYNQYKPFVGFILTNYSSFKFADSDYYTTKVLRYISNYLKVTFKDDAIFYFGRGTFIISLQGRRNVHEYVDKLNERFERPFEFENGSLNFEVSCFYNNGDLKFKDYDDLRDTLNIVIEHIFDVPGIKNIEISEEFHLEAKKRRDTEKALKYALDHEENLLVYYQPIYSNNEKRIVSAEALVRIYDPILEKIIFPDDFIRIAERNGSIMKLGMIVFKKVCRMIKEENIKKYGITSIEINLSPQQCIFRDLSESLINIVNDYEVDPEMIIMEITETEALDKSDALKNIDDLLNYGIRFSLDDYGTGYSNLVNIIKIPFDIVKIDKSICWDYFRSGNDLLLWVVRQFLDRNKKIIVEGVEDEEMVVKLDELGVHYQQGYYFSKPVPLDVFIEKITNSKSSIM